MSAESPRTPELIITEDRSYKKELGGVALEEYEKELVAVTYDEALAVMRVDHKALPPKHFPGKKGIDNSQCIGRAAFLLGKAEEATYLRGAEAEDAALRFSRALRAFENNHGVTLQDNDALELFMRYYADVAEMTEQKLVSHPRKVALYLSAEECQQAYRKYAVEQDYAKTDVKFVLDKSPKDVDGRFLEIKQRTNRILMGRRAQSPYISKSIVRRACIRSNDPWAYVEAHLRRAELIADTFGDRPELTPGTVLGLARGYSDPIKKLERMFKALDDFTDSGSEISPATLFSLVQGVDPEAAVAAFLDKVERLSENYADHPELRVINRPFGEPEPLKSIERLALAYRDPEAELEKRLAALYALRQEFPREDEHALRYFAFNYRKDAKKQTQKWIRRVGEARRQLKNPAFTPFIKEYALFMPKGGVELAERVKKAYASPSARRKFELRKNQAGVQAAEFQPFVFEVEAGLECIRKYVSTYGRVSGARSPKVKAVTESVLADCHNEGLDPDDMQRYVFAAAKYTDLYLRRTGQSDVELDGNLVYDMAMRLRQDDKKIIEHGFSPWYNFGRTVVSLCDTPENMLARHNAQLQLHRGDAYAKGTFFHRVMLRGDNLASDARCAAAVQDYLGRCHGLEAIAKERQLDWLSPATIKCRAFIDEDLSPEETIDNYTAVCAYMKQHIPQIPMRVFATLMRERSATKERADVYLERFDRVREEFGSHPDFMMYGYTKPTLSLFVFLYLSRNKQPIEAAKAYLERVDQYRDNAYGMPYDLLKWGLVAHCTDEAIEGMLRTWRARMDELAGWSESLDSPCEKAIMEVAAYCSNKPKNMARWLQKSKIRHFRQDISLDRERRLADNRSPEEIYIAAEESLFPEELGNLLRTLDAHEQQAVIRVFDITGFADEEYSGDDLYGLCGVADAAGLEHFVETVVLEKLRAQA